MPIDNQIEIPQSFMAMYILPGHSRPNARQEVVLARYEQCEDMASMLTEHAQTLVFKENCVESEVLVRCFQGLTTAASDFTGKEAEWVICRLAELMGWTPLEIAFCLSSVDSSERPDVEPHPESVNKKVKNRHDFNT